MSDRHSQSEHRNLENIERTFVHNVFVYLFVIRDCDYDNDSDGKGYHDNNEGDEGKDNHLSSDKKTETITKMRNKRILVHM